MGSTGLGRVDRARQTPTGSVSVPRCLQFLRCAFPEQSYYSFWYFTKQQTERTRQTLVETPFSFLLIITCSKSRAVEWKTVDRNLHLSVDTTNECYRPNNSELLNHGVGRHNNPTTVSSDNGERKNICAISR